MDGVLLNQDGVLTSAQAEDRFGRPFVRAQLAGRRWQRPVHGVVVTHNGPLTDTQRAWLALLSCPPDSALGGLSALVFAGLEGFVEEATHVVLPEGSKRPRRAGLIPHWSTQLGADEVHPLRFPRRTRPPRSVIDAASWSKQERRARAVVLAAVQQGVIHPRQLRQVLPSRGACRHRALIDESILDAGGGIHSLPELDFEHIRRRCRLPPPDRQSVLRRSDGRYYLDVKWRAYAAACEIHGIPHLRVLDWESDLERANEITIAGPRLLIFSSYAVRRHAARVGDQLERLLRRGGYRG